MSKEILNTDKLATLSELRYLLLEVMNRQDAITWYELSFSCKEFSFHFAYAFESTIAFLEALSILKVGSDKSVTRVGEDYASLNSEYALSLFILNKTLAHIKNDHTAHLIFNKEELVQDAATNSHYIDLTKNAANASFVKVLLLSLGMVEVDKTHTNRLLVSEAYKTFFNNDFFKQLAEPAGTLPEYVMDPGTVNGKKPTVFISYASKDEEYKEELQKHLSGLVSQGFIESWDGRAILPGMDWDDEVKKNLEQAEMVLFLVSSDFMASSYVNKVEIKNTMERHNKNLVKIIPVIVRPCDFKSLLIGKYQALPTGARPISEWPSRDAAYLDVVTHIKKILSIEHK